MTPEIIAGILGYGGPGLVILILLLVAKRLFDLLTEEQKAHRITAVTAAENSHKFADALENTNDIIKNTNEKIDKGNEKIDALGGMIRDRLPAKSGGS
jgi:hypothetical protein